MIPASHLVGSNESQPNELSRSANEDGTMQNIRKACLLISYSNGGVNRDRSEARVLREMQDFIESRPYNSELKAISRWLGTLTEDQLETVCDGEQSEAADITKNAPAFTETLLNDYFEDVC